MRILFVAIAYNTDLVKKEDAPKGFRDLLDPKWMGKMVKAHPGYSGAIMTATFAMARDLGWEYFEKLAKQKVMQVQSAVDPPKKIALGERAVMADGGDYNVIAAQDQRRAGGAGLSGRRCADHQQPELRSSRRHLIPTQRACSRTGSAPQRGRQTLVDITAQYAPHAKVAVKAGRPPARRTSKS